MILIADSGSTKTEWLVIDNNICSGTFITSGFNPYYFKSNEIELLLANELPINLIIKRIKAVIYYGSGCSTVDNCSIVRSAFTKLFFNASITIHHDMLAAAHALLGHSSGIACILGTGSNSCLYDGENIIQQVPSLGYLLGDEGSATAIGKKLITSIIYNEAPTVIIEAFKTTFDYTLGQILDSLYRKEKPGVFLSGFSKFVGDHISHPFCHDLVSGVFDDFIKVHLSKYGVCKDIPVSFTGSVAFHFKVILKERLSKSGIQFGKIQASPAEGLIDYHTSK
jgi:N-acetylglucosamine kinase-like BadF-type ATPase